MRIFPGLLTVVVVGLAAPAAHAQDELPAFTRESFPLELAARPLVLPAGMFEVRAGAMSDVVGLETDDMQVRTRLDAVWSPMARAQLGVETDMLVFPTDHFEVRDVVGWAEYSLMPKVSFRVGAYAQLPRGPAAAGDPAGTGELEDGELGLRAGVPLKITFSRRFAVTANPRYGALVAGGSQQDLDLPFTVQLALVPQISLYASSGLRIEDVGNFDVDTAEVFVAVPAVAGVVLTPGNLMDLGVDVRVTDVSDETGRTTRWVFAYLALRR